MKEFLLQKKWVGAIIVVLFALLASVQITKMTRIMVNQYAPVIVAEAADFLPITIKNGQIVAPEDTEISKSYQDSGMVFNVVLDTRVDEFEASKLSNNGLYVSRKYIYGVSPQKTEIRSLADMPDGTVDREMLEVFFASMSEFAAGKFLPICWVMAIIWIAGAILLYTIVSHWLIALLFHNKFSQTLRINTLTYVVLGLLTLYGGIMLGVLVKLGIMLLVNAGVNSFAKAGAEDVAA